MSRHCFSPQHGRIEKTSSGHCYPLRTTSYGAGTNVAGTRVCLERAWTQPFPAARQGFIRRSGSVNHPIAAKLKESTGNVCIVAAPATYFQKAKSVPELARPTDGVGSMAELRVEGLDEFLAARGLEMYSAAAANWCADMGAAYIEEVLENHGGLADALGLSEDERQRLLNDPAPGVTTSAAWPPPSQPATQAATNLILSDASPARPSSAIAKRTTTLDPAMLVANSSTVTPPVSSSVLMRTRTSPTTGSETSVAQQRAERAYIPLQAWTPHVMASAPSISANTSPRVLTSQASTSPRSVPAVMRSGDWQVVPSDAHPGQVYYYNVATGVCQYSCPPELAGKSLPRVQKPRRSVTASATTRPRATQLSSTKKQPEDDLTVAEWLDETVEGLPGTVDRLIFNQGHYYRKWGPNHGYVEPHLLRQRVPRTDELEHPFLKEIAEAKAARKETQQFRTFEQLRNQFLREHGRDVRRNLGRCLDGNLEIKPATVSADVQRRFMEGFAGAPDGEIIATYHGSNATNYNSICERGLLIPGSHNGLRVEHGAAHGRGVYTARVGAPELSRGFCTEPQLLVCGVVDDAVGLPGKETCGRFSVSAKSATIKHVGDAVVVKDERRVAPLFMVTADNFKSYYSSWNAPNSGGGVTTVSGWMNGRLPLPGEAVPMVEKPHDFVNMGKGKALHVPSGQTAFMPPEPEDNKWGINQKRIYESRRRDRKRAELRAEKIANQQL